MSVYDRIISRIPFSDAYNEQSRANDAGTAQSLQQAGQMMTLQRAAQEAQQSQQKLQRQEEARRAVAALGPNATQEQVMEAVRPFSSPDQLMSSATSSADRRAKMESESLNRGAQLEQRRYETDLRSNDAKSALEEKGRQDLAKIAEQAREGRITREEADARARETRMAVVQAIAANRAPPQEQAPIAIPDPASPTGFRFGSRSDAMGRPAPAPAGATPRVDPLVKATHAAGLRDIQRDEKDLGTVNQLETALKRWKELNAQVTTGRVAGMRPALAQPMMQEMVQLQNYLAVNNFKPGQGQISNFERQLIKGAGPTVNNDEETNQRIADIQLGGVQNARDRHSFREMYLEKNNKLLGADKAWNEYIEKNPRYSKGPEGSIVPNAKRKEWTEWFGSTKNPAPVPESSASPIDALLDKYK